MFIRISFAAAGPRSGEIKGATAKGRTFGVAVRLYQEGRGWRDCWPVQGRIRGDAVG